MILCSLITNGGGLVALFILFSMIDIGILSHLFFLCLCAFDCYVSVHSQSLCFRENVNNTTSD